MHAVLQLWLHQICFLLAALCFFGPGTQAAGLATKMAVAQNIKNVASRSHRIFKGEMSHWRVSGVNGYPRQPGPARLVNEEAAVATISVSKNDVVVDATTSQLNFSSNTIPVNVTLDGPQTTVEVLAPTLAENPQTLNVYTQPAAEASMNVDAVSTFSVGSLTTGNLIVFTGQLFLRVSAPGAYSISWGTSFPRLTDLVLKLPFISSTGAVSLVDFANDPTGDLAFAGNVAAAGDYYANVTWAHGLN